MAFTVTLEAELSPATWTDITSDTVAESGMSVSWGMDGGQPEDNCASPGSFSVTLNNAATSGGALVGRYSPGHANATAGWDLNTALRLTLSDGTTSRVMGPYRVTSIAPDPGLYRAKRVTVTAADWLEEAAQSPVSGATPGTAGEFIRSLVDGVAVTPEGYSIDAGASPVVYVTSGLSGRSDRVLSALKSAAQSDGGHFYLTSAGVATYRAASARAADTTADFSFVDDMHALDAGRDRESLVNTMRLTVHPPVVSTTYVVVAALASPLLVPAGGSVSMWMAYRDPDTGNACGVYATPRTPERNVNWAANSREDGTGADVSLNWVVEHDDYSDSAVLVTVSNIDSADGYLTLLNVLAISVVDADPVTVQTVNSASVTAYGERVLDVDMPYQHNANIAQSLANYWADLYSDAAMRVTSVGVKDVGGALLSGGVEHLTDGGMESWASATNLTSWTESVSGTSTVNREATNPYRGEYCTRLDVDASNSTVYVVQSVTLVAGALYRLVFRYRTTGGMPTSLLVRNSAANVYLTSAGAWSGVANTIALPAATDWTTVEIEFAAHASYTAYQVFLGSGTNFSTSPSSSSYFDDISLVTRVSLALTAEVGSRVNVTESMLGLVTVPYWVQGIAMQIDSGPVIHTTLRLAPASNATPWLLGVAGRTELGSTTVLGYL